MKLHVEWGRPISLRDASKQNMIYDFDESKVSSGPGIYIFGRQWSSNFEAFCVGKAANMRSRIKGHLNNLHLMKHLVNAKNGRRLVLAGRVAPRQGQNLQKCLRLTEKAFIRYFLFEGHDLVNKQGTRLRRHEVESTGQHPKRFFPNEIHLERAKGD